MTEFVNYLHEVFAEFGPIATKPMFGGYGVYHNELMIGLVANDVLYLKADIESAPIFEAEGLVVEWVDRDKLSETLFQVAPAYKEVKRFVPPKNKIIEPD